MSDTKRFGDWGPDDVEVHNAPWDKEQYPDKVGKDRHGEICVRFRGCIQRPRFNAVGPAEVFLSLLQSGHAKPEPEDA